MKSLILFPLTLLTISCSSIKTEKDIQTNLKNYKIENNCPKNVNCNFEILQNKSLNIITDEIGMSYYELTEDTNKTVFRYQYNLTTEKELQDGNYLEEVLFEVDKNYGDFNMSGKNIQKLKAILNVMCFCRGKAGTYNIKEGQISKNGKNLLIKIPSIVSNQKIDEIKITL